MRHGYPCLGYRLCKSCGAAIYALNEIIKIKYLTAAAKLSLYRLDNYDLVVLKHVGLNGKSVAGRFVEHRHVPDAAHSHIQRSRDRRRAERENVNVPRYLLQLFLLRYSESLLLVHDEQSKVLEFYIL